ncbi:MAG: UDP-N-acetylmuramate--L-alanine ligase [Deltaproteobacteria bacterium]|nr:MAG: UDP-N-acetylmuramate--L-alanine ligase [Deltaproteobacteria bacterium]
MYGTTQKIHFVGIGGIGMSGIAGLLISLGYTVSGSDLERSAITDNLLALGASVNYGHRAEWVEGADVVVTSSAIAEDNPEVIEAERLGIPVIQRAEMLAELMRLKKFGIAVAGSHGKTSTTSMIGWLLAQAGLDPTIVVGGRVDVLGGNAKLGEGEFLVAEADESDGSFLKLSPVLEVITSIDLEHLDYYNDIDQIKDAFLQFIDKIPFYGAAIVCLDDKNIVSILPRIKKRVISYGLTSQADVFAENIKIADGRVVFTVRTQEETLGKVALFPPGRHNVYNALGAVCVGLELKIPFAEIVEGLARFGGVQRRMQLKGKCLDIMVVDDYGHHPTEIRATISAVREAWPETRLVVLFQPHRYSRTRALFEEFQDSFHQADVLVLTEVYAAGEAPIDGASGRDLLEHIKLHGQRYALFFDDVTTLADELLPYLQKGDLVLTLGAGNIVQAGERLLALLKDKIC